MDKYTLIGMLGDNLLTLNTYFKAINNCTHFAHRSNNHPPIPNKEGKMEKMKAYCKLVNTSTEIPKLKQEQI